MDPEPDPGGPKHVDPVDPDPQHWQAVLRIHDILVWIRIRIRISMPQTNGSGSGCVIELQDANKKLIFLKKFFLLITF